MRKSALLVLVTLAGLWASGERVFACVCAPSGPPCQKTWEASAVFVGEVTAVDRVSPPAGYDPLTSPFFFYPVRVSFKVVEAFRGELGLSVDVYTGTSGGDCGYKFEVRRTYVVYGHRTSGGQLTASICSRTKPIEEAADDIQYLRGPARASSSLGTIQGVAKQTLLSPAALDLRDGLPIAGARVTIESLESGRKDRYESVTGPDGTFSVRVPVGEYRATLIVREGLYALGGGRVKLLDGRGCAHTEFAVGTDGRLSGRVIDADGRPVPRLSVDALTAREAGPGPYQASDRSRTDDLGVFEFTRLPPDAYVLGLTLWRGLRSGDSTSIWFARGLGVSGEPIGLAPEQRKWIGDVHLPASVRLASIAGVVFDADGMPAAEASVYLMKEPDLGIAAGPIKTDARGEFAFTVVADRSYRLRAEFSGIPPTRYRQTQAGPFTATSATPPFRLSLPR